MAEKDGPNLVDARSMISATSIAGTEMPEVPAASRAGPNKRRRAIVNPPIIDIDRAGRRKPGSLIPWPG